MVKINKILWTTDGSKEAQEALNYAKVLAKAFNSEIVGLHVIKSIDKRFWGLIGERLDIEGLAEDASIKANWFNVFEGVQEELNREGLEFSFKVLSGAPHEKIIEVANEEKADFIIMGKRGLGLKGRMLIGSNTIKVLQRSQLPVKILNEIRGLHDDELKNKIAEIYSQEGNKVKIKHKVIESINPYLGIIRYAEDERPDLIVMNTHGRKGIKKLMLGSVAEKVIQETTCSILAIKPTK